MSFRTSRWDFPQNEQDRLTVCSFFTLSDLQGTALTDTEDSSTDPDARATLDAAARPGPLSNISPEFRARQTGD